VKQKKLVLKTAEKEKRIIETNFIISLFLLNGGTMEVVKGKHIGVYGIIIKEDKIVLIKKACGGYKGKLDLPGGGMEYGEQAFETLKRELMEEAGVVVNDAKLFDIITNTFKWQMTESVIEDLYHIGILYMVNSFENELKNELDNIDSLGADWYSINELDVKQLSPFAKFVVENYSKYTL